MTDKLTTPLVFPEINVGKQYNNILLINSSVSSYQSFVDSVNETTFPIVYSFASQKKELLSLLQTNFTNISRIGLCFESTLETPSMFLDYKPLFSIDESIHYSENVEFLIYIIKNFSVKNIDFLACDTLNYSNWVNYYSILSEQTNVVVGASNDKTGNIKYGGDWIMESTSQNIELVYFTKSIEYYTFLLDNPSVFIPSGLVSPFGMAFDNSGNVYVSNLNGNTIGKYSSTGATINASYITGLNMPNGIAFDSTGNLYVANLYAGSASNNTVSKYSSTGAIINASFISGLTSPCAIAFDSLGNLYITSYTLNGTVGKYSSTGATINASFITGLNQPRGIAFDNLDNLYVVNWGSNTVGKYTSTGTTSTTINASFITGLSTPVGIAFDSAYNLYIGNYSNGMVGKYTSTGTTSTTLSANFIPGLNGVNDTFGVAVDSLGNLYVTKFSSAAIYKYIYNPLSFYITPLNVTVAGSNPTFYTQTIFSGDVIVNATWSAASFNNIFITQGYSTNIYSDTPSYWCVNLPSSGTYFPQMANTNITFGQTSGYITSTMTTKTIAYEYLCYLNNKISGNAGEAGVINSSSYTSTLNTLIDNAVKSYLQSQNGIINPSTSITKLLLQQIAVYAPERLTTVVANLSGPSGSTFGWSPNLLAINDIIYFQVVINTPTSIKDQQGATIPTRTYLIKITLT